MLNLKIIIGTTRPGRAADRVIPWITGTAGEHGGFDVDALDLRDWPLPLLGETFATMGDPHNPTFSVPVVKQWNAKIAEGDACPFVTPEYNHSIPAVLKNAIDSVFATFAFRGKPAAYVGYSGGIGGGIRDRAPGGRGDRGRDGPAAQQRDHPVSAGAFGPDGQPKDPRTGATAKIFLDDLAWWARALQQARAVGTLPPLSGAGCGR